MSNVRTVLTGLVLAVAVLGAAPARVAIRPAPRSDLTLHVTTTQALSLTVDRPAGDGAGGLITSRAVLAYAQANGRFDDQGRMDAQLTIERLDTEQTFNGVPKKSAGSNVVGQSLTIVLDRAGKLVDVKVPKELDPVSSTLKQLIAAAYSAPNFVPDETMAVGETSTTESEIPLRLPGAPATGPYRSRTELTLRAIETRGDQRIAHLEQRIQPGSQAANIEVSGAGTIDVNLDRGFITGAVMEWTFAGTTPATTGTPPSAAHGTIKINVTATEQ